MRAPTVEAGFMTAEQLGLHPAHYKALHEVLRNLKLNVYNIISVKEAKAFQNSIRYGFKKVPQNPFNMAVGIAENHRRPDCGTVGCIHGQVYRILHREKINVGFGKPINKIQAYNYMKLTNPPEMDTRDYTSGQITTALEMYLRTGTPMWPSKGE